MAKIIRDITAVLLGSYPQGTDGTVQPIEWEIMKREGNKALLVSKNILSARRFNYKQDAYANSEIRNWLNNEFLNAAFDEEEREALQATELPELPDSCWSDQVFLLDSEEALRLYKSNKLRCKHGAWWLRPSYISDVTVTNPVIGNNGKLCYDFYLVDDETVGVVPALWADLDSDIFKF